MNKELKDRQNVVEYLARTLSEPLDFNLVISSVTSAESKKDLNDNLLAIFDLEDPNFSEKFTVVQYYAAALGARAGNPKRLRKDEIISEFDLDGRKVNFKQSLNILRDRVAVPKTYYEDLPKELRAMSFYVSGLEKLREVEIIQNSLGNAINKGFSFKEWKDRLDFDGLKNLSDARLETVFRNNTNTVYNQSMRFNAGTSDVTPYLMYSAVGDADTRPSHQQLDGIIKRADSVFWDKFTAPLDHNCRCGLINLTEEEAQDMGISTRSVGSFKNIDMFDDEKESGYGDFLSSSKNAAQRAVDNRPDKDPFKSSFQNSLNKVDQKVDIWWEDVKNIFEEQ